jgi:two-component system, OmpR family, response regulator CpxR
LLLIDDDRQLCSLMGDFLMQQGFAVSIAYDGLTGLAMATSGSHDLVLLDVVLPGLGGFAVLDELRRVSDIPVLMLTARGEPSDRVFGLSAGADDYLPKPFDPAELVARVHAILRRSVGLPRAKKPVIEIAGVCLDTAARQVSVAGVQVDLTSAEYGILEILMRAAGRPVSRDEISIRLNQREAAALDRAVDVHISRIRHKLGPKGALIQTVRGAGYLFALDAASGFAS